MLDFETTTEDDPGKLYEDTVDQDEADERARDRP